MSKLIFDIIPPRHRAKAQHFWKENSGKIKLGTLLLFLLSFFAIGIFVFTNRMLKTKALGSII